MMSDDLNLASTRGPSARTTVRLVLTLPCIVRPSTLKRRASSHCLSGPPPKTDSVDRCKALVVRQNTGYALQIGEREV